MRPKQSLKAPRSTVCLRTKPHDAADRRDPPNPQSVGPRIFIANDLKPDNRRVIAKPCSMRCAICPVFVSSDIAPFDLFGERFHLVRYALEMWVDGKRTTKSLKGRLFLAYVLQDGPKAGECTKMSRFAR